MDMKHFGDSYDIVKKSLLSWLTDFGPWVAHPMFTHSVPASQADAFSRFLDIPLASREVLTASTSRHEYLARCGEARSVFLDPDTGLRLERTRGRRAPEYVFGEEIVGMASVRTDGLIMSFDQSLARGKEREQVPAKLRYFLGHGLHGVAYVSHASFLIVGRSRKLVAEARKRLTAPSRLPGHRVVGPE